MLTGIKKLILKTNEFFLVLKMGWRLTNFLNGWKPTFYWSQSRWKNTRSRSKTDRPRNTSWECNTLGRFAASNNVFGLSRQKQMLHPWNSQNCADVAPVESDKTTPRLYMNWSILTNLADTPFPRNLKIAGSNPLHWGLFLSNPGPQKSIIMEEKIIFSSTVWCTQN